MKLLNFPFLVLTISLVTGIILGHYFLLDLIWTLILVGITIITLGISWFSAKKMFKNGSPFTIITFFVFITIGIALVKIHNPTRFSNHYTNILSSQNEDQNGSLEMQISIKERLKPTPYYEKYIASLSIINDSIINGDILLQIPKDGLSTTIVIGDRYTTFSKLKPIPKPLNPYQFDYASYLSKNYISYKLTVSFDQLLQANPSSWSLFRIADQIRTDINKKLLHYDFSLKQLSIINALLLGQRQDIDAQTFSDYRDAGAIHLLAVSGLHVGIILMLLNLIFKPLERFGKKGSIFKTICIILLLWCFAVIAGLSPSVIRAVTMFSFLAIGMQIRSKTSIYNALLISMFLLLCCNPLLLFSVGFQLSYLAVFSIVWVQPSIARHYTPRFYIDKKIWETFTVTIAAQLGVLPLTLFYFHQFPLLFIIANLIIIPVLGFILGFGILVIILAELQVLPTSIVFIFRNCIDLMNATVHWVAQQEKFLITNISFSWRMMLIFYILITSSIFLYKKYTIRNLFNFSMGLIVLLCLLIYEKHHHNKIEELVIFHNRDHTIIGSLQNQQLIHYSKDRISKKTQNYILNNYSIHKNVQSTSFKQLSNIYKYQGKTLFIIDSAGIYNLEGLQPDIILLSDSPKIHLDRVIKQLQPKLIIADGSNYKEYLNLWESSCAKQKLPFHRTDKKGAYIVSE